MSSRETAVDVPELPLDDVGGAGTAEQQRAVGQDGALLSQAIKRLVAVLAPERIYLFGSHARGDATAESDYDLFVVVPHTVERPYILEQQALAALWEVPLPVDVLVMGREKFQRLRPVVASLPATVVREGRLLYAA